MYKLPAFLMIAEARCGTTSLYEMMTQHPQIVHARVKELYYLRCGNWKNKEKYKKFLGKCSKNQITGEATPSYMYEGKAVIPRILKIIPNVKFIVMLRNPVEKVYSHFILRQQYYKLTPKENLQLFIKEAEKYLNNKECNEELETFFKRAKYFNFVKEWVKYFPKEQFLIIKSEDFFKNPCEITNQVFKFLNLKNHKTKSLHLQKHEKIQLPLKIQKKLINYFKPYNKQLYKLLNRNFNWESRYEN